jgi:DNA-binding ferritin-like protein
MKIPGLSEALEKMDDLPEKMSALGEALKSTNEKLDKIADLLEEQNEIHQTKK